MTAVKLTPQLAKNAKPPEGRAASGAPIKQRRLKDDKVEGLELLVERSGRKTWSLRYRPRLRSGGHGRQRRVKVGTFCTRNDKSILMGLAEARDAARDIIGAAAKGRDPVAERTKRAKKKALKRQRARTGSFKALAGRFISEYLVGPGVGPRGKKGALLDADGEPADIWKLTKADLDGEPHRRSWSEQRRKLLKEVLPQWGDKPARKITSDDVTELLEAIAWRGAPVQANRVRALLHKLFAWAKKKRLVEINPVADTERPGGDERQRDRVLNADELRTFWAATEPGTDDAMTAAMSAFWRLRLITAQRAAEVVAMRWDDIDEDGWWTIRAAITKNKKDHRVWLSETAREILTALPHLDDYVLAGARGNRQRSEAARLIHEPIDNFRGHDLRRTASSYMGRAKIPRLHIAKVLNHSDRGVTAIYDRHSYDPEKRVALDTWAAKLQAILQQREKTGDVMPITAVR